MEIPKRSAAHALRELIARDTSTPDKAARRLAERAAQNDEAAQRAEATAPERRSAAAAALRDLVRYESAAHLAHVAARIAERGGRPTTEKES